MKSNMSNLEKYIIARWCYAIGEDFIDDIEYRYLEDRVKEENPDSEYLSRSWSHDPCPTELLDKYDLQQYKKVITFSHTAESIPSINSMAEFEARFAGLNEPSRLSFKHDGFNIQANYLEGRLVSCETRGRRGNFMNASTVMGIIPNSINMSGKVIVTGEAVIPNDKWETYKRITGNTSQRNSISTALANGDTEFLDFMAFKISQENGAITRDNYHVLQELGFKTSHTMTVSNITQLKRALQIMGNMLKTYNRPTDGLVIENNQYQLAIRVGAWQEEILQSYITGYAENIGSHRNSMLVEIQPITYKGAKRSEVSVTNIQTILDNDLRVGSPVAFDIRSEANAVLNTTMTRDLQEEWCDRYEEYREYIDKKAKELGA